MSSRLVALFILVVSLLPGLEAAADDRLDEIVTRMDSRDPFTAYQACKDLVAWAGDSRELALETLHRLRRSAVGRRAESLDDAITHLGGTPPPPPSPDQVLDDLLDRLADEGAKEAEDATTELDAWAMESGPVARKQLESRLAGANARRHEGIGLALARLDRLERVKALEESSDPDVIRAAKLLRGVASRDPFQPKTSSAELRQWACIDAEKVRARISEFREHTDGRIAEEATAVVQQLDRILKWLPLLKSLETLQVPTISGCQRISISRTTSEAIPAMPGETNDSGPARGWLVACGARGTTVLFDDGCIRTGRFTSENTDFSEELPGLSSQDPQIPRVHGPGEFWRAALFARWALEQERLDEATACVELAGRIAEGEWPGETPEKLAGRLLRRGADYLLRRAGETFPDFEEESLGSRLAALPFVDARERGETYLRSIRWCGDLRAAWRSVAPEEVSAHSMRMQVDYWTWRLIDPESARSASMGDLIESADSDESPTPDPVFHLAALGWKAVPFLAARLDEGAAIAIKGPTVVHVGEVYAIVLWRLMGDCARPLFISEASAPWNAGAAERQQAVLERWRLLDVLDEHARWLSLHRDHSPRATGWLLAHDPAAVVQELFAALPDPGRPRILATRRLEARLALAPREKLEGALETAEGELREVLQDALDRQASARSK